MLEHVFRSHERIQALREGPHSSLLEGFAEELHQTGYAKISCPRAHQSGGASASLDGAGRHTGLGCDRKPS